MGAKAIKLWGEMGEFEKAIDMARRVAGAGRPDVAYLTAGDAARVTGNLEKALQYYRTAADMATRDKAKKQYARASAEAVERFLTVDMDALADGTYTGRSSSGYKGPVQVKVKVAAGRIASVTVTNHRENWYGASLQYVPEKLAEEGAVVGVDAVTGATATSRAIVNATMDALAGGPDGS